MTTCVALLRAVNVAGHNKVAMADLCSFLAALGLADPRAVLQTGNLVFGTTAQAGALERRLEAEAAARLGLQTDFFVRTASEWRNIIARNPFRREAEDDPSHLIVVALKAAPADAAVRALRAGIAGRERVAADGRHLYVTYPDGIGRSRLTGGLIEKALATRGTARNWNTVLKVGALSQSG